MDPLSAEVFIDAPRERVFDYLCDLANHPSFIDHFVSQHRLATLDSAGAGATARFKIDAPLDVLSLWVEMTIAEADRPYRLRARGATGRLGRVPVHALYELTGEAGGLTRTSLTVWTEAAHAADRLRERLGRSWARRRIGRALGRLRGILEAGG